jgi:hypothetical protein
MQIRSHTDQRASVREIDGPILSRIAPFLDDLRRQRVHREVLAVVVVGSAARGEQWSSSAKTGSDVDIMVITRTASLVVGRRIRQVIARYDSCGLEGGQVPVSTLSRHRTLLNYEARWAGWVIEGDREILDRIPMATPTDIPRWEAVRLLFNRMMEHVKLRAGSTTPARVVQKTYEALGEALLVMEGRYQPTFRGRLDEIQRAPIGCDAKLRGKIVQALERRFCDTLDLPDDASGALSNLRDALELVLARYTGVHRPIRAQIDHLARTHTHLRHRLYWVIHESVTDSANLRGLLEDPSFGVWRSGLAALDHPVSPRRAESVVRAWARCPQILDAKDTP